MHIQDGLPAPEFNTNILRDLVDVFANVLMLTTTILSIAAVFAGVAVAITIVNPNFSASPFSYDHPTWGRWAWGVFVGCTILGPVLLGVVGFGTWGYLIVVAIFFGVALGGLMILRRSAGRS